MGCLLFKYIYVGLLHSSDAVELLAVMGSRVLNLVALMNLKHLVFVVWV